MTTHELGKYLIEHTPDKPVFINGWGSDEGTEREVTGAGFNPNGTVYLGHGGENWRDGKWHEWYMTGERLGPNSKLT